MPYNSVILAATTLNWAHSHVEHSIPLTYGFVAQDEQDEYEYKCDD